MHKNNRIIGQSAASRCFYLPTAPKLDASWCAQDSDAVEQLIKANGNHWRKIMTIMAKLSVSNTDWKTYRDLQLLKQNESIAIEAIKLNAHSQLHFVCGQQSAQRLQLNLEEFKPLIGTEALIRKHINQPIYLCPYLDYRQFPNRYIDTVRQSVGLPLLS